MINKGTAARCAAGLLGGLMLAGVGTAAFADLVEDDNIDVKVEIAPLASAGELSLTVAANESTLTEGNSNDPAVRMFTGTLPDVTVTDTREEAPAGVFWYVTGQASDFVGNAGQPNITPDHLGWAPELVNDDSEGEVAAGEEVPTALDDPANNPNPNPNNVGLQGQELLQMSFDSAAAKAVTGSWTANALLTLKTAATVAAGNYTSVLTLSLFEDEIE